MCAVESVSRRVPRLFQRASSPPGPIEGDLWSDTGGGVLRQYAGGAWRAMTPGLTFDIRSFGAVGNGVADDTVAVQAALDAATAAGGITHIPRGTFLVNHLLLPSHTRLRGDDWGSVLKFTPTRTGPTEGLIATNVNHAGGDTDIGIENLALDGAKTDPLDPAAADEAGCLAFNGVVTLRIHNVLISDARNSGIVAYNTTGTCVTDTTVLRPAKFGIFIGASTDGVDSSQDVVLERCRVIGAGRGGIIADSGYGSNGALRNVTIAFCTVADCTDTWDAFYNGVHPATPVSGGGYGIGCEEGIVGLLLVGNTVTNCVTYGVWIGGGQHAWPVHDCVMLGNTVEGSTTTAGASQVACSGFRIEYAEDGLFRGNVAHHLGSSGFFLRWLRGCTVEGNLAYANASNGFYGLNVSTTTLRGNVARNNGQGNPSVPFAVGAGDGFAFSADTTGVGHQPVGYVSDALTLAGNRAFDDQATKTQRYGFNLFQSTAPALHTRAVLHANDGRDNLQPNASLSGVEAATATSYANLPAFGLAKQDLVVATTGGDYTTLSAALAAITDASAAKVYSIRVVGTIEEPATVNLKSYVQIEGLGGAIVQSSVADALPVVQAASITNCRVGGVRFRKNAVVTGVQVVFNASGSPDNTVVFERCAFENLSAGNTSTNTAGAASMAAASANIVFRNCDFVAGDYGHGLFDGSGLGPLYEQCRFTGGALAATAGALVVGPGQPVFRGCVFLGGASGSACALIVSSIGQPRLEGCTLYARAGAGSSANGLKSYHASAPTLAGCTLVQQGNAALVSASDTALVRMDACTLLLDPNGASARGILLANAAEARLRNCSVGPLAHGFSRTGIAATTTFVLDAANPTQLDTLMLIVGGAGSAGQTVSIGTTLAGTDIVNAQPLDATGTFYPTLGTGALKLYAANATFYVTVSGGSSTVALYLSYARAYAGNEPVYLNGTGKAQAQGCVFASSVDSDAGAAAAAAVTANAAVFEQCTFRSRARDASRKKAFNAASAWNPAPFHRCVFDGGQTNLTCSAGVANGSSLEI